MKLDAESKAQDKTLDGYKKQSGTDEKYLLQQQELIVKLEMASELGERANETDSLRDEVKARRAANQKQTEFVQEYQHIVHQYAGLSLIHI